MIFLHQALFHHLIYIFGESTCRNPKIIGHLGHVLVFILVGKNIFQRLDFRCRERSPHTKTPFCIIVLGICIPIMNQLFHKVAVLSQPFKSHLILPRRNIICKECIIMRRKNQGDCRRTVSPV